jgi:serine/threonine protein phosphatase PrpC
MGNLLGSPVIEKDTHSGKTEDGLEFGVSSMQGWRVHMEDDHICEPKIYAREEDVIIDLNGHSLFAVFDGHGGTFAAQYAGNNLLRVLSRHKKFIQYAKFHQERQVKEAQLSEGERASFLREGLDLLEGAFRDAFLELDSEIYKAKMGQIHPEANKPFHVSEGLQDDSAEDSTRRDSVRFQEVKAMAESDVDDSGTTAVVVMITPDWILCANSGDSRSVISKQNHKAVPLSYDHKPDDAHEQQRIKAAGGYVAGGRVDGDLAVSRGLGDFRFKIANTVCQGNTPLSSDYETSDFVKPEDQKVSPVPDIIVQNRSCVNDEFIVVACDGIWDVKTNQECVKMIADIFSEGESNIGLLCEEVGSMSTYLLRIL